jgi:integrase
LDLAERVWTIPAARMKSGKEHRVRLSDAALAVLQQPAGNSRPFPYQITAMLNPVRRRMQHPKITTHGFCSTFADWATEQTSFPPKSAS